APGSPTNCSMRPASRRVTSQMQCGNSPDDTQHEDVSMQLGMIGLGRMGSQMVRRLMRGGHECVVYDVVDEAVRILVSEGAVGAGSPRDLVDRLELPRTIWLMAPAAVVDSTLTGLVQFLDADDVIVDGGNSWYRHDIDRARQLSQRGIHYV